MTRILVDPKDCIVPGLLLSREEAITRHWTFSDVTEQQAIETFEQHLRWGLVREVPSTGCFALTLLGRMALDGCPN